MIYFRLLVLVGFIFSIGPSWAQQPGNQWSTVVPNNTTGVLVKPAAGVIFTAQLYTIGSVPVWLKFYDQKTAPTCGSGIPSKRLLIPAASTAANGGGNNPPFPPGGIQFNVGIAYCVTGGIADNDTTAPAASSYVTNFDWK